MKPEKTRNDQALQILADNLLAARRLKNLTRRSLAQKAGVHEDVLQKIEMRHRLPNLTTLVALADALDVAVDSLLVEVSG